MTKYRVRYSSVAIENLSDALDWGARTWGDESASNWLDDLENHIESRLSDMPLAFPLAPEAKEFEIEIRNIKVGRYRVLYSVSSNEVLILAVRGPYAGDR